MCRGTHSGQIATKFEKLGDLAEVINILKLSFRSVKGFKLYGGLKKDVPKGMASGP
jgi:hypothetical protein